jgi:hypothetical protein
MGSSAGGSETHGTCPKSILAWYDAARPVWIDLKELFLIEGDSLLKECFEDERIDFKGIFACCSSTIYRLLVCCCVCLNNSSAEGEDKDAQHVCNFLFALAVLVEDIRFSIFAILHDQRLITARWISITTRCVRRRKVP